MSDSKNIILHIDTATTVCSVAVSENGEILCVREVNEPNVHASILTLLIERVLADAGYKLGDLCAISVNKGPGSYTGLRIGVAVAKGLCYALDLPLLAVDGLYAMALAFMARDPAVSSTTMYCPMIDARRMEVFTAFYDGGKREICAVHALIVDPETFDPYKGKYQKIVLFGPGADKLGKLFEGDETIEVCSGFENSAAYLVEEGHKKYDAGAFEDPVYFEPFYLKEFVATTPKKLL